MSDKTILERIKKLFSLAKSSNPHEAALALNRAQKLMIEHGLTAADFDLLEIGESVTDAILSKAVKPPEYFTYLVAVVCRVMGVKSYFKPRDGQVIFIGRDERCSIAVYAYEVLARQIKADRLAYIRGLSRRMLAKNRTARADRFCEAWVGAIFSLLEAMSLSDREKAAIEAYQQKSGVVPLKARASRNVRGSNDAENSGWCAGRNAYLRHGVGGRSAPATSLIGT